MLEDKKMKVKKGWLAVQVGVEDEDACSSQRFLIPISCLYHPLFRRLLDKAYEVYGYHTDGPLKLPCSVDDFLHLRWRIEKESSHNHHHNQHHHHNHHPHALLVILLYCLHSLLCLKRELILHLWLGLLTAILTTGKRIRSHWLSFSLLFLSRAKVLGMRMKVFRL